MTQHKWEPAPVRFILPTEGQDENTVAILKRNFPWQTGQYICKRCGSDARVYKPYNKNRIVYISECWKQDCDDVIIRKVMKS